MQGSKASGFESFKHTLRGGFLTKFKGQTVSCPPGSSVASTSLSKLAISASVALGLTILPSTSNADDLFWDGTEIAAGTADGGAGDWETGGALFNWDDAAAGGADVNFADTDTVNFGGVGGAVVVSGAKDVPSLTFTVGGYTISGDDLGSATSGAMSITNSAATTITSNIVGVTSVTKAGAGTLTLDGTNDYTGLTTITTGTLELSGGAAIADTGEITNASTLLVSTAETIGALNGAGGVTLDATLTTGDGGDDEISGIITGAGGLTKEGGGTLTLSGANDYTGATTINDGVLQASNASALGNNSAVTVGAGSLDLMTDLSIGSLAGAGVVTLNANTLTTGGDDTSTDYSGAMSGAGGLTKEGTGTQTLSGANVYTGATTINDGVLQASNASALGNNSAVTVGAGSLDLMTDLSIGSLAGAGVVTLNANTLTTGGDDTSTDYSGAMSGAGGLTKEGTGTQTLSGTNLATGTLTNSGTGTTFVTSTGTWAGTTSITGGTVVNDGTLTGATTIAVAGTLTSTGSGTITGATINMGTVSLTGGGTGQSLAFEGGLSGVGAYDLDVDLTTGAGAFSQSDFVVVRGGGPADAGSSYTFTVTDVTPGTYGLQTSDIILLDGDNLAPLTFTVNGLPLGGAILYTAAQSGDDIVIQSNANPGIGGIIGGVTFVQSLLGTIINRPSSANVSALAYEDEDGCSNGLWGRATRRCCRCNKPYSYRRYDRGG